MENRRFVLPTWELVGGESKTMTLTLEDSNGQKYNLPGCDVVFTITDFVNSDETPVVEVSGAGRAEITQDNDGTWCECKLTIVPNDTASLSGKYIYQAKITDGSGNVSCPQGILIIHDNNN